MWRLILVYHVMAFIGLAVDLNLDFLSSTIIRERSQSVMHRRWAYQRLRVQVAQLIEDLLFGVDFVKLVLACGVALAQLVEEVVLFSRVLKLLLIQDNGVALDAVRATVIHKLLSKVDVSLIEVNHIVSGLQIAILDV